MGTHSKRNHISGGLGLKEPDAFAPSAFFLGPNAENIDTLTEMVEIVLKDHAQSRRDYSGDDPDMYSPTVEDEDGSREKTKDAMIDNIKTLTELLRGSVPLSSYRNQSHMYWDLTMAGSAGYFAGMLYNQNNVAAEASPVTTALEIKVARDLCEMLGFDVSEDADIRPWGKLAGGGSIANFESMWAARNLKYQAPALARAIRMEPQLAAAQSISVEKPDGSCALLLDLDTWELVNLSVEAALKLRSDMTSAAGIGEDLVSEMLDKYSPQGMGFATFYETVLHGAVKPSPAIILPATAHYSWPKAAAILGLGYGALRYVPVDMEGRMDLAELHHVLAQCLEEKRPVVQVIAVMGTTEEGSVDPLDGILELRDTYAKLGLTFCLHADAAWGGYFASMLREPEQTGWTGPAADEEETGFDSDQVKALSKHVRTNFELMSQVDSITLDPHKSGFIPYPAGALCYRNRQMINLVAYNSPVVSHSGGAPTVGTYGIEGSRPGAVACGVALSHVTTPPNQLGYGRILGRCIFNAKRFYAAVATMVKPEDEFIVIPFNRLPIEKAGGTQDEVAKQLALVADKFVGVSNEMLMATLEKDKTGELLDLFQDLGPDLTVMAYSFNFSVNGKVNTNVELFNEFNEALFAAMSLEEKGPDGEVPNVPFFVTEAKYDPSEYGEKVLGNLAARAGLDFDGVTPLRHLISTMQNPFVTNTAEGNFIPNLMKVLRSEVIRVRAEFVEKHSLEKE